MDKNECVIDMTYFVIVTNDLIEIIHVKPCERGYLTQ